MACKDQYDSFEKKKVSAAIQKGDKVCWLDRAKPGGSSGWQKIGTVIGVKDVAHIKDEDGRYHNIELRELTVMEKIEMDGSIKQAVRIRELEEENKKLRAELSNLRSQNAT